MLWSTPTITFPTELCCFSFFPLSLPHQPWQCPKIWTWIRMQHDCLLVYVRRKTDAFIPKKRAWMHKNIKLESFIFFVHLVDINATLDHQHAISDINAHIHMDSTNLLALYGLWPWAVALKYAWKKSLFSFRSCLQTAREKNHHLKRMIMICTYATQEKMKDVNHMRVQASGIACKFVLDAKY